jgi:siroheme synthase
MGVGGLPRIAETLLRHGRPPETPVAVVAQGTTAQQQVVMGTLATIADEVAVRGVRPPATVIVGDVVRLAEEISWYRPVSAEPAR